MHRPNDLFAQATDSHRASDFEKAKSLYRQCLQEHPDHAAALHLLGFAEFQSRNFPQAVESIRAAVMFSPENAEFHNNLGLAYFANRQLEDARRHAVRAAELGHTDAHGYWHVALEYLNRREFALAEAGLQLYLEIQPAAPDVHNYLGLVYSVQQRYADAEACYRRSLGISSQSIEALNNLGNAIRDQNRWEEAIPYYRQALQIAPTFAAAHNNLGVALIHLGRTEEGIACYERALRFQPDFAEALNNLGNAHRDLGNSESAIDFYRRALVLQPRSPEIQCNLGVALRHQGQLSDAIRLFRRGIILQPESVEIHSHLTSALLDQGKVSEAANCCRHVSRLQPNQPLWQLQAASICQTVFLNRQEMNDYLATFQDAIESAARSDFPFELSSFTNVATQAPFNLQFFPHCLRKLKESYAALFAKKLENAYRSNWVAAWHGPADRPRIGFVVTEQHESIFLKSLQGVLARLSVRDFELVIFCSRRGVTQVRSSIARDDVQILPLPARFDQIVRMIDDSRCDILYYWETGTDTSNYFLPFLRLAPIQMTSWGIQVTSGIPNLDYYMSNSLVEPSDGQSHYSEELLLADTLLTYRPRAELLHSLHPRDSFGVPTECHWYVCAQQLGKFHIDFDEMLAEILRRDNRGVVVISGNVAENHRRRLQQRLIDAYPEIAKRTYVLPKLDKSKYISLLNHATVLLDPPHFGGVTSTYDGLSLGKPIVVLPSRFHRGRYTLGCYRKMDLMDCVATDTQDYARIAVRLATEQDYRKELELRIWEASSVLFEDFRAVLEHERIFHELLSRSCSA